MFLQPETPPKAISTQPETPPDSCSVRIPIDLGHRTDLKPVGVPITGDVPVVVELRRDRVA